MRKLLCRVTGHRWVLNHLLMPDAGAPMTRKDICKRCGEWRITRDGTELSGAARARANEELAADARAIMWLLDGDNDEGGPDEV